MTTDTELATEPVVPSDSAEPASRASVRDYELGTLLGRGGMGEVVLAHDPKIGRDVALKRMRGVYAQAGSSTRADEATARFLREAKIQARLDHPAIVPVHEVGRDRDGSPYFTMKRLTGTTLAAKLDKGHASEKELLRALIDVAHAIELAHARGVVHRDLKPANIMLGDYGEVYVLDWGVARVLGTEDGATPDIESVDEGPSSETQVGTMLGTPGYMPPEQARGADVGTPADIYALGAILFEVLAGEPLHPRGTAAIASTLEPGVHSPATRIPARGIAPELDALCAQTLADDPRARPTARAYADRLQSYLDGDRDLARRRELAAEHLAVARAAFASGDPARRAEAVRTAGQALALDPTALEAAAIVTSLIVTPPTELPPELRVALQAADVEGMRARSRRAVTAYIAILVLVPFLPLINVQSWTMFVAVVATILGMAALAYVNWRVRVVPTAIYFAANVVTALMFSRLLGPFILTPTLISAILLSVTTVPWLNDRPCAVVVGTVIIVMTPFALEAIGVFAPTWHYAVDGLVSHGTVFGVGTTLGARAVTIGANLGAIVVVAAYARRIGRDRRDAQRTLFVQAWHLQQLLPRAAAADKAAP